MNKAMLIGRLGADPQTTEFGDGGMVSNISVATSKRYKDKSGHTQEATEWHRISAYGKLAEIVKNHFYKGMLVYVEGEIRTRSWVDNSGTKRYSTEIVMSQFEFLSSKESKKELTKEEVNRETERLLREGEDDLPF